MIRHIVMWKFREGTEEKANEFLTKLAALDGVIPQLKKCEVARNIGEGNYDAVLVSEFESMDDLNAYKVDPRHVAVSDICKSIRADGFAERGFACFGVGGGGKCLVLRICRKGLCLFWGGQKGQVLIFEGLQKGALPALGGLR